ncbi:MAG: LuxR C-terminal-related transcriptional regulator [Pikeienuella sp.]|uniref:LuxR C-terminal-related transcriptional regulator n=1 Tax=Pikeienuella sp. TaxID=2831957 RepID=UPI00391DAED0
MSFTAQAHARRPATTVAVIDRCPVIHRGLAAIMREDGRFELAMVAADAETFLSDYAARGVAAPIDVAVSGWDMPGGGGLALLRRISQMANPPRVLIYTGSLSDMTLRAAIREGAAGLVRKTEPPGRLLQAIAAVAAGGRDFPAIQRRQGPSEALTKREREILDALAGGATNGELAAALGVSVNTVKFHLRNLFEKLNVRNRANAVALWLNR